MLQKSKFSRIVLVSGLWAPPGPRLGGPNYGSCLVFFEISMIFKIVPKRVYRSRRPQNEWPTSCSRLVKNRICRSRQPPYRHSGSGNGSGSSGAGGWWRWLRLVAVNLWSGGLRACAKITGPALWSEGSKACAPICAQQKPPQTDTMGTLNVRLLRVTRELPLGERKERIEGGHPGQQALQ